MKITKLIQNNGKYIVTICKQINKTAKSEFCRFWSRN